VSNYKSEHNFEGVLRRILESNVILANEIKVIQEDNSIDLVATFKKNTILIQNKSVESAITINIVQDFESAIS
ncbi:15607_t:CDS:1, partial [Dentiscutata heterogama]